MSLEKSFCLPDPDKNRTSCFYRLQNNPQKHSRDYYKVLPNSIYTANPYKYMSGREMASLPGCRPPDRNFPNIYETVPIIFGNILLTITFVKTPTRGGFEFCLD